MYYFRKHIVIFEFFENLTFRKFPAIRYNKKPNKQKLLIYSKVGIQVTKSSETRDEWWYYSIAWYYFGIEQNNCYNMPM